MANRCMSNGGKNENGSTAMNDSEFKVRSDAVLARIEQGLEASGAGLDCCLAGDGVLEIEFDEGGKMVVNRHAALQEIWVADRSGGYHFAWDGEQWRNARDGSELFARLMELLFARTGEQILLD